MRFCYLGENLSLNVHADLFNGTRGIHVLIYIHVLCMQEAKALASLHSVKSTRNLIYAGPYILLDLQLISIFCILS